MTDFKSKVGQSGCHIINIGELLEQIDNQVLVVDGDKIKIPSDKIALLIGIIYSKLQETFRECEGKELVIDFGDSVAANTIEAFLKLLLDMLPKSTADVKPA